MREIKFRAWDGEKWWGAFTLADIYEMGSHDQINAYWTNDEGFPDFKGIRFVQFTGQKDKNGAEIYDGHIVRRYYRFGDKLYTQRMFIVRWRESRTHIGWSIGNGDPSLNEIVGHIYENPELAEEVNNG